MRLLAPLLFLSILGSGCSKPARDEIVGQYSADRGYGLETLWLRDDGQYEQKFTSGDSEITRSGRWIHLSESSNVVLIDAFIFDDGFGRQLSDPTVGGWSLGVRQFLGRTSLEYGEAIPFTEPIQ